MVLQILILLLRSLCMLPRCVPMICLRMLVMFPLVLLLPLPMMVHLLSLFRFKH